MNNPKGRWSDGTDCNIWRTCGRDGWTGNDAARNLNGKTKVAGHPYLYCEFGKLSAFRSVKSIYDNASFREGKESGTDRSEDPGK